ncbi:hypothetical protein DJ82_12250 [Halorubrum sp. Ib24]|uniref:hypothetical protein n=1 Tax=Halorubrum sp. Ib24 TaxID=1383850 RepID=UPI000B99B1A5|nr:hypothetical protein [Halorubrum sp. Ib24]OYR38350.1 hypothetical protein DJ82_12250 [Halorubrum sp. Ib24]
MTRRDQIQSWLEDGGFLKAGLALGIKIIVELGIALVVATGFATVLGFLFVPPTITATSITLGPGFAGVTVDEPTLPRWVVIAIGSLWMWNGLGDKCFCRLV